VNEASNVQGLKGIIKEATMEGIEEVFSGIT
jgi:hypothetical protein